LRSEWTRRLEDQARRLNASNEERKLPRVERAEREWAEMLERLQQDAARSLGKLETSAGETLARLTGARRRAHCHRHRMGSGCAARLCIAARSVCACRQDFCAMAA
jgi:hypothetical protein